MAAFDRNHWQPFIGISGRVCAGISKYERDEVKHSIDVVKKITSLLGISVGYLLGETEEISMFKDPNVLKQFNDINGLSEKEKEYVYSLLEAILAKSKSQSILK